MAKKKDSVTVESTSAARAVGMGAALILAGIFVGISLGTSSPHDPGMMGGAAQPARPIVTIIAKILPIPQSLFLKQLLSP